MLREIETSEKTIVVKDYLEGYGLLPWAWNELCPESLDPTYKIELIKDEFIPDGRFHKVSVDTNSNGFIYVRMGVLKRTIKLTRVKIIQFILNVDYDGRIEGVATFSNKDDAMYYIPIQKGRDEARHRPGRNYTVMDNTHYETQSFTQ
jgi:hypothetical protein